jgi:chromosome partitioning protein
MAKTLAIIAAKGGVGKTTTAVNLGGVFASQGGRTLLIDTDPQSSLSKFFLGTDGVHNLHRSETVAAAFDDSDTPTLKNMVHATPFENLFLTPASDHLKRHNHPEPLNLGQMQFALQDFVQEAVQQFDFIIVDCPPDVSNLPTHASLLAVDFAVAPILPERFSVQAIAGVDAQLAMARTKNNNLTFLGYFLTQRRTRLGLHDAIENNLRSLQGERVFTTVVPQTIAIAEAQQMGQPITLYDASTTAAKITAQLAGELLQRMNNQKHENRKAA